MPPKGQTARGSASVPDRIKASRSGIPVSPALAVLFPALHR
ncbi:hypothetical protein GCM10007927_21550 [Sulfitobacter pacificus]|uniref:Uncharacterized protein n=1 Tax=Sulfitobacter pacificus TaxID=1499314 RepID=A0ABQ5VJT2_9RHOB|nr:hypothetical protein GCM10007927_21550 [Sulfitobacter pacificus]